MTKEEYDKKIEGFKNQIKNYQLGYKYILEKMIDFKNKDLEKNDYDPIMTESAIQDLIEMHKVIIGYNSKKYNFDRNILLGMIESSDQFRNDMKEKYADFQDNRHSPFYISDSISKHYGKVSEAELNELIEFLSEFQIQFEQEGMESIQRNFQKNNRQIEDPNSDRKGPTIR